MNNKIVNVFKSKELKLIKTLSLYFIVSIVSILYLSHFTHFLFATDVANDEGVMSGAWRIVQGQVIYRDFFEFFAPGNFFLLALIYKLFGYSLIVTNKAVIVLDVICNILLFQISYMMLKRWYAIIPPLLFLIIGFPSWFIFSHYWTTSVTFLTALILLTVYMERLTASDKSTITYLFLSGFFVGLTGIFLQSAGIYTTVVLLIVLYLRTRRHEGIVKRIAVFGIGIAIPVLAFVLYLLLNNAFMPFIHSQIILLKLYPPNTLFYSKPLISFYNVITPVKLMIVVSFIGSIGFLILKKNASNKEVVLFAGNIIFFLYTWHWLTISNSVIDPGRATSGLSFTFIIYCVFLFTGYIKNHYSMSVYKLADLFIHGAFMLIAAISIMIIYKDISNIRTRVFHFTLNNTSYWTYDEDGAKDLIKFNNESERILGNDREVFAYPLASTLYTLLNLRNTTKYDIIVSFGQIASGLSGLFKDVVDQLERLKIKYIITYQWSYRFIIIWAQRNGVGYKPNMIEKFIWDNYEPVVHVGLFDLWKLKLLKAGDVLTVTAANGVSKKHASYRQFTVGMHGNITSPHNKRINVSGMPLYDLKDILAREYGIPSDEISITTNGITSISSEVFSVSITGAVYKPGRYFLNQGGRLTDVMMLAGGPLTTSDLGDVIIKRGGENIDINFLNYFQTHNNEYNPVIEKGDKIYIPQSIRQEKVFPGALNITLLGTIQKPGRIFFNKGARLMDAIGRELSPTADLKNVIMIRGNQIMRIDFLRYIQTHNNGDNPLLENGDIIYLPETGEVIDKAQIIKKSRDLSK
ncbi:MAG: SLBB domain-containing protein [Deltaproteobacteria bacterium]|nr:SLBB domain-containing protein [Deltaproteobacteria bacterium]